MTAAAIQGHLYLVGFMGSGKSAMGRLLAEALQRPFVDLDSTVEERSGHSIPEIFERRGEVWFRELEFEALRELAEASPAVIATGGGAFDREANRELMRASGLVVWLDVPLELAQARALKDPERPLATDSAKFDRLYRRRRSTYRLAHLAVEVGDDPKSETRDRILQRIESYVTGLTGD